MRFLINFLNDLAALLRRDLIQEIESLREKNKELAKEIDRYRDSEYILSSYLKSLKKYRDDTLKTVRNVCLAYKDFYSLMRAEFFNWDECFNNHWEKRLYDRSRRYTEEDKENLEVKEFGNFIVGTYPRLVNKLRNSLNVLKNTIIKLAARTKQQEERIRYLENLCKCNLIEVGYNI